MSTGYIAFGRQTPTPPEGHRTIVKTYPVVGLDEEMCEICDQVDKRDRMHKVGFDSYAEDSIYVCDQAHPTTEKTS